MSPILEISGLSLAFRSGHGLIKTIDDLTLSVSPGDVLGIVGESGSGKSQLLLSIMGLQADTAVIDGDVRLNGSDLARLSTSQRRTLRSRTMAMIFQDPASALNPYLTIGRQLTEVPRHQRGITRHQAENEAISALEQVRMTEPWRRLSQYPHELSGGMRQRVMIAMALLARPALILADEPTTALDVTVQAEILDIFAELTKPETGTALILVTHDLGVAAHLCRHVAIMYAGRIVETGPVRAIFKTPQHPYTRALLAAMPHLGDDPNIPLKSIGGHPPRPSSVPIPGCAFAPRCPDRVEACHTTRPHLRPVTPDQQAACILVETMAGS